MVFGGCDPETEFIVTSAFQEGFNHAQNIRAWEKVGAVPLSRKCLESKKVRRSIGDGDDEQQALVHLIQEHNTLACTALTLAVLKIARRNVGSLLYSVDEELAKKDLLQR